jgi:hypothetical protein
MKEGQLKEPAAVLGQPGKNVCIRQILPERTIGRPRSKIFCL